MSEERAEEGDSETCAICLESIQDPASLPCMHVFCFECVITAAEIFSLSSCAVCRTPFSSVRHGGREEPVMVPSRQVHQEGPTTRDMRREARRHRRSARRNIYLRRLFARPLVEECPDGLVRMKDTSPAFYKHNPAALHPLVPFMHRDLRLFLPSPLAKELEKNLIQMFKRNEIMSESVTNYLEPFLGRFSIHFQHEVRNFAQSIYNLDKYDRLVQYRRRVLITHSHLNTTSTNTVRDSVGEQVEEPTQVTETRVDCFSRSNQTI